MKTIKYLLIAIITICAAACSDDDDPFAGTDNFIKSFVLTQDGTKYTGVLEGDNVLMYFNDGVYAQDMKVSFELSENAQISPDPQSVSNWLEEQQFVVSSYSGNRRVYRYIPKMQYIARDGDIILKTQEEVDKFSSLGITHIKGNLIIGNSVGEDSISSTTALSTLKKVDYDVIVNKCFNGETIIFEGLEEAGSITLNVNPDFGKKMFPSLKKVALSADFGGIYYFEAPNLEVVGKDLKISNLSPMYCETDFPNLKKVEGTFTVTNNQYKVNTFSLPRLEEVGTLSFSFYANNISLPSLSKVTTGLSISGDYVLAVDLPQLHTGGNITFSTKNLVKLNMPALEESGNISYSNLAVRKLDFSQLKKAGNISLSTIANVAEVEFPLLETAGNISLSSVTKINKLKFSLLKNALNISVSSSSSSISPKVELDLVAAEIANLTISYIDTIKVKGSGKLTGSLSVSTSVRYCKLDGITQAASVQSTSSATYLECIGLENITGNLLVSHRDDGKTLLPDLKNVGGYMTFQCYSVKDIAKGDINLGKLETVVGKLTVSGYNNAPQFTNLSMFSTLKTAGSIAISNLKGLTNYSGLKNVIPSIDASKFTATNNAYNPTYQNLVDGKWTAQ